MVRLAQLVRVLKFTAKYYYLYYAFGLKFMATVLEKKPKYTLKELGFLPISIMSHLPINE